MSLTNTYDWYRKPVWRARHPGAPLPHDQNRLPEDCVTESGERHDHATTGRTSMIGRRCERPAPDRLGGPSGQTDSSHHDQKHANT